MELKIKSNDINFFRKSGMINFMSKFAEIRPEQYKKLFDENLCLIKESYIKETEKKKWSFSWLWLLLLLIPAGYYGFKWIKKNYTINI